MNRLMAGKSFLDAVQIKLSRYIYSYNSPDATLFFDKRYLDENFKPLDESTVPAVFKEHIESRLVSEGVS